MPASKFDLHSKDPVSKEGHLVAFPDFDRWYSDHGGDLLRYCESRLGKNAGEDVYQLVWLKAIGRHEQFDGGNERAWLFQIARTSIIDWNRKKRPESNWNSIQQVIDPNTLGDEPIVDSSQIRQFRICISRLSPAKRNLLHLKVTGHSYQQIGRALSIAIGTVGSQFHRICKQVRKCMEAAR